ncbi:exonuclease domain-containing protein [Rubripirellula amarantea]|uniref:DNA polymerase III PolC-type n=1 Tax=Rubripirellula amarantea TaxID=2527999 RepID=A0A5C5WT90_9BACT|nr:exonuclease domain-containing protein [Rubripirellula amarantea]MDA8745170.1 exonuclease domain-containing protein [Rubripirellula amarantea]TWT53877.1 DNA polymerase III PolC-type [Rubripirellula amarantea]
MAFSADFTAIDFETANRRPDSACQLAAVIVRGGQIVDQAMWMIRPRPLSFSPSNIRIHGISPAQVRDESEFGDLWDDIAAKIGDDCIVAHNASFDIGVLKACLQTHHKSIPEFQFTCTRAIARRTWPHRKQFGLKPLSDWLGVRFRHHDALEDSIACAKILLAAGIDQEATSLEDLESRLKLTRGSAGDWGYRGPTSRRSRRRATPSPPDVTAQPSKSIPIFDLQRLMIRAEFIRPLHGKRIVFTGKLKHFDRQQAEELAARLGGTCHSEVGDQIDYLIVGRSASMPSGNKNSISLKEETARYLQQSGKAIEIVGEDEFLNLIVAPHD